MQKDIFYCDQQIVFYVKQSGKFHKLYSEKLVKLYMNLQYVEKVIIKRNKQSFDYWIETWIKKV